MDYIFRGNDKDVSNVLKEQRIRIGRGVVSFTPISECGLITEEDARRTLEDKLAEKDEKIATLITERDSLKNRVVELETLTEHKDISAGDSKTLLAGDSKEVVTSDEKEVLPVDEKESGKNKSGK